MNNDQILALVIGAGVAIFFGAFIARKSAAEDKIHGGTVAQVFHYIASACVAGVLPVVIASLVLGNGFRFSFPAAIGFLSVGWLALLIYAAVEKSARDQLSDEDQGWTAEDARTSGL